MYNYILIKEKRKHYKFWETKSQVLKEKDIFINLWYDSHYLFGICNEVDLITQKQKTKQTPDSKHVRH